MSKIKGIFMIWGLIDFIILVVRVVENVKEMRKNEKIVKVTEEWAPRKKNKVYHECKEFGYHLG